MKKQSSNVNTSSATNNNPSTNASSSNNPSSSASSGNPRKPRENILDLNQYISKQVLVKFIGGREVYGTLRGFDNMINLVLEDCYEFIRDLQDHHNRQTDENNKQYVRKLGIVICRGTSLMHLCPVDGTEEIENPFEDNDDLNE